MSAFNHLAASRNAAALLDMTRLFGFARVAGAEAALADAVGIAYNKRGTETPKGQLCGVTEGVPTSPALRRATEGVAPRTPTEGLPGAATETPPV